MDVNKKIEEIINSGDVVLFMKGTPEMPQCGFSMVAVNILKHLKINFNSFDVYSDENIRQGIKKYSNWPTIPQIYVKKEFIGGSYILKEMFEKKELSKFFLDKGIQINN